MEIVFLLTLCLIQGAIGYLIARGRGRGKAGFWWSFFFSWIGWIIAACLSPSETEQNRRMMMNARMIKEAMRD